MSVSITVPSYQCTWHRISQPHRRQRRDAFVRHLADVFEAQGHQLAQAGTQVRHTHVCEVAAAL